MGEWERGWEVVREEGYATVNIPPGLGKLLHSGRKSGPPLLSDLSCPRLDDITGLSI